MPLEQDPEPTSFRYALYSRSQVEYDPEGPPRAFTSYNETTETKVLMFRGKPRQVLLLKTPEARGYAVKQTWEDVTDEFRAEAFKRDAPRRRRLEVLQYVQAQPPTTRMRFGEIVSKLGGDIQDTIRILDSLAAAGEIRRTEAGSLVYYHPPLPPKDQDICPPLAAGVGDDCAGEASV